MLATELDNTGSYIFDTNDLIDGRYIFEIYAESPETLEWDYDSVGLIYIDNYENEPIAHAGYDTAAVVGETVILDGSRSYDVDPYDDLNFYWQQITGPVPSAIMNQYSRFASFVPAAPGTYLFNLCVDDGYYGDCDEVIITVTGEPMPQALKIMKPQEEEKEPLVRDIFVSSVEADDNKVYYEPGERMHLSVSFANELEEDIEQATVQIIAPKLRLLREFGPFELEEEEMVTKEVVFTIPEDAKPGTYEVRVIITTPEDQRVKIRKIKIL